MESPAQVLLTWRAVLKTDSQRRGLAALSRVESPLPWACGEPGGRAIHGAFFAGLSTVAPGAGSPGQKLAAPAAWRAGLLAFWKARRSGSPRCLPRRTPHSSSWRGLSRTGACASCRVESPVPWPFGEPGGWGSSPCHNNIHVSPPPPCGESAAGTVESPRQAPWRAQGHLRVPQGGLPCYSATCIIRRRWFHRRTWWTCMHKLKSPSLLHALASMKIPCSWSGCCQPKVKVKSGGNEGLQQNQTTSS